MALTQVALNRNDRSGLYADILDACEDQQTKYGSATNALAHFVFESPLFQETQARLREQSSGQPAKAKATT